MANQVKIQIEAKANLAAIDEAIAKLKALKDKTVKVNIDLDQSALRKLDNIKDKRIKVDLDVNDSKIRALRDRRVKVTVDVDSGSLTTLQSRLAAMRNQTVRVRVQAAEDRVSDRARDLIRDRTANINVALNGLVAAEAQLTALARNRRMSIRVDMDAAGAAALHSILSTLQGAGNAGSNANRVAGGLGNMASSGGRLTRMLPALVALAPAIGVLGTGAITAGIYGTAAALGAVTAVAGGIGAAVTGGLSAIPIAAAATSQEVKDHFSYMKNDVVDTMKQIAQPVQQPLINLATSLGAAFHQVRPNLEAITNGTADLVNHLSGKLPEIAGQLGPALEKAFQAGVPHMKNLIDSLPALSESFGNFMQSLGSPEVVEGAKRVFESMPGWIEGAGRGVEKLATGFNNVMGFFDAGKMDGFTQGFSTLMDSLGGADWSQVTEGLSGAASAFGDFLGSIDGQAVADGIQGIAGAFTTLTKAATVASDAFNIVNNGVKDLSSLGGKEGKGLMDFLSTGLGFNNQPIQDFWNGLADALSGGPQGEAPEAKVKVTPEFDKQGLMDLLAPGQELKIKVTPEIQGEIDALPPAPLPIDLLPPPGPPVLPPALLSVTVAPPPPVTIESLLLAPPPPVVAPVNLQSLLLPPAPPVMPPVDLTAGPIPPPLPPPPVPVDVVVANGQVTVPPPPPVPVTFDVTQPTLNLEVPPVPITFNVTLPQITIPPVEAQAFVTVSSNASSVAAEIEALKVGTSSFHTVSSNVSSVAGEIQSLNGQNTSSTHTINVVKTGDTGQGAPR